MAATNETDLISLWFNFKFRAYQRKSEINFIRRKTSGFTQQQTKTIMIITSI